MSAGRVYLDRFGNRITDPAWIEWRRVATQYRRLATIGHKAGLNWDRAVTVGALAKATKKTPDEIIAWARDGWLTSIVENEGPIETWGVFEDGE